MNVLSLSRSPYAPRVAGVPLVLVHARLTLVHSVRQNRTDRRRRAGASWRAGPGPITQSFPSRTRSMSVPAVPPTDLQAEFVEHLPVIERILAVIARRHVLSTTDAEEFSSWVRARIIDSDYAVFRKFGGRSSMATYLSVVLGNLFHDYRNLVWGRWRPSAVATRMGPVGVRLEELLFRDGYPLRECVELLQSRGVPLTGAELGRMASRLPARVSSAEVPLSVLDGTASEAVAAPDALPAADDFAVLRTAIAELSPEEQVIMKLRFWDDFSIADIARTLQLEQKPLYRRIEAIEQRLRERVVARGLDRDRALDLLASDVAW